MKKAVLHAEGEQEHSLCGMAFDAYESGDADAPIVFARDNEVVTCEHCRRAIDHVRKNFRRYRYMPQGGPRKRHD